MRISRKIKCPTCRLSVLIEAGVKVSMACWTFLTWRQQVAHSLSVLGASSTGNRMLCRFFYRSGRNSVNFPLFTVPSPRLFINPSLVIALISR
jgi:hypothetical protein